LIGPPPEDHAMGDRHIGFDPIAKLGAEVAEVAGRPLTSSKTVEADDEFANKFCHVTSPTDSLWFEIEPRLPRRGVEGERHVLVDHLPRAVALLKDTRSARPHLQRLLPGLLGPHSIERPGTSR